MKQKIQKKAAVTALVALAVPIVLFYLLEWYTHNPWTEVRPWAQLFNILLFELAAGLLIFLTGRIRLALRIEAAAAMLFGIANAYVVRFRTNPIVPWDIFSLKTAVSVADNYDFVPDVRMIVVTVLFLLLILALRFADLSIPKTAVWKRLIPAAVVVAVMAVFANTLQQEEFQNSHRLYNKLFTPVYMTNVDGIAVTFVMNLAYVSVERPKDYQKQEAQEILEAYEDSGADAGESEELPNIIVMMNESFADLSVLGGFETNRDYMPYLHSLQQGAENTITGMLNVSVCGGNTANTEFEFLTGNTMAFLPQGSIPYQQYITGEIPSLAEHLASLGYKTIATHPYRESGWERNTVYPLLGFSESIFIEGYRTSVKVRQYVSDEACVNQIIRLYEEKGADTPLFVFNVTMQNHGGYKELYPNFEPDITVDGMDNISLEQYLSLVELSDAALEKMISYFAKAEEKTVIVFFGDHQPSDVVAASILQKNGMKWNALSEEELKLRYQVPYVIWANYDIEEATDEDISVNYLAAEVLNAAGVPTSPYQNFLLELKEEYPVISTVRTKKSDGSESFADSEGGTMDLYRKLQYYQLFDQ